MTNKLITSRFHCTDFWVDGEVKPQMRTKAQNQQFLLACQRCTSMYDEAGINKKKAQQPQRERFEWANRNAKHLRE